MNLRVIRRLSILAVVFEIACSSSGLPKQEKVADAVTPKSVDLDLTKMPKSKQWKPGDPVYEMPDLKQTPSVNEKPVAPTLFEGHLPEITTETAQNLWTNKQSECSKSTSVEPSIYSAPENSRWLIARLVSESPHAVSSLLCIAVNRNEDGLSGGWYLYDFKIPGADLTLVSITLTEKYYEFILRFKHSFITYKVSLNDLHRGKTSSLIVKQTLVD